MGLKTLDPGDKEYQEKYDNADDSSEYYKAQGFAYHLVMLLKQI